MSGATSSEPNAGPPPSRAVSAAALAISILLSTAIAAVGKHASLSMASFDAWSVITNPWYMLVLICHVLQALAWPVALRGLSLTTAYMATSLVFVNILFLGAAFFSEAITPGNAAGVALIAIGNVFLMGGVRDE